MNKYGRVFFVAMVFVCVCLLCQLGALMVSTIPAATNGNSNVIVIDPGHGGFDPGKVGINDALEKEINLSISFKLKMALEKEGYEIVLTRTTDTGLNTATDKSKKSADMRNRVKVINDTKPLLAISIHQNSYPSESVKGAQVFYYKASEEGKKLAEIIQESMKRLLDSNNKRVAKDNSNYYMLTHTQCPTVIVECGFLSNQQEARMLLDEDYQEKVAMAITNGVKDYVKQK